jgi:hypothetical protein
MIIKFNATVNKTATPALTVAQLIAELQQMSTQSMGSVRLAVRQENGPDLAITGVAKDTDFEPLKNESQVIYLTVE